MSFKNKVIEQGMRLMADPRIMKLVSNPRVMNLVMKGFVLRGRAQAAFDAQVRSVARSLKLATRDDVGELKQSLRSIEHQLRKIQELHGKNGA
jgi:hypothetical protein